MREIASMSTNCSDDGQSSEDAAVTGAPVTASPVVYISAAGCLVGRHETQDDALTAAILMVVEFHHDGIPLKVSVIDGMDRNFLRPICFVKATT